MIFSFSPFGFLLLCKTEHKKFKFDPCFDPGEAELVVELESKGLMGLPLLGTRVIGTRMLGGGFFCMEAGLDRLCAAEVGRNWDGSEVPGQRIGSGGGFSHESEHDLAVLVSDFLENDGSGGAESWCSSDSDNGNSDLGFLAEKISLCKHIVDPCESDLLEVIQSLLLSISDSDLYSIGDGPCNGGCIRRRLVKLLNVSGYNAAICRSKWQGFDKVPGGDHEYVDVIVGDNERLIVDIDFKSHFQIARAVESYDLILKILPVVYVGTLSRLDQLLHVMVEATKSSLRKNSMPLPPWRSLSYLQAKWHSTYERVVNSEDVYKQNACFSFNKHCLGHLRRLKSSLKLELEKERLLMPTINDKGWRKKPDKKKTSFIRV